MSIQVKMYGAELLRRANELCKEEGGEIASRQVKALANVIAEELYELKNHAHGGVDYQSAWEKMASDLMKLPEDKTFTVKQITESMITLEKQFKG